MRAVNTIVCNGKVFVFVKSVMATLQKPNTRFIYGATIES